MRRAWHNKIGCPVNLIVICLPASGVYLVSSGTFTHFWAIGSARVVWSVVLQQAGEQDALHVPRIVVGISRAWIV